MTQLKLMVMAIFAVFGRLFALPALAAKCRGGKSGGFNFLRALCIVFFAAAIGGCGDLDSAGLISAAREGNITEVKRLLDNGADIETKNILGFTPLSAAALAGQTESVLFLVKAGADVNTKGVVGQTPLHSAASGEIVSVLIKAGADIKAKSADGDTPLRSAAGSGQTEAALALVKAGADINGKNDKGWTPLYIAVRENQTETALALIKAGSDGVSKALQIAIDEHGKDSEIALSLQSIMEKQGSK